MVGAQQFLWCTAVENVPQLPRDVETILDGHVHSLSSLSGVGVAGVASEEYTRGVVDIVESINQAVAHFVDRVPGDFFHVDGVRRVDFIRLLDDLFHGGLANIVVIIFGHFAEIDVHPGQVSTFAWNM